MIPIRDLNPTRSRPVVTKAIIALNVAVFAYQLALGADGNAGFIFRFGAVPYVLTHPEAADKLGMFAFITPLTSMFMHGGFMHIIGNMWFLWVFGDNVEDALGRVRFVLFYLLCGLLAVGAQVAVDPQSTVPMVGASGAISGVLAGYVILYPRARVVTLVPIVIFLQFMELPAYLFIVVWIGFQLLSGYLSLGAEGGGVAYFAHIGGFLAGLGLVFIIPKKRPPGRERRTSGPPRSIYDRE